MADKPILVTGLFQLLPLVDSDQTIVALTYMLLGYAEP